MLNEELLWQAVMARDSRWDGVFVYGVRSTHIYCRPTCPSRRPVRNRVTFFAAAAAAEQAGFRACRRCGPAAAASEPAHVARVRRVCTAIAQRPDVRLTLPMLARAARTSPHHLLRTFKQVLGITPREYASACREGCLRARLRDARTVTDATYEAGYGSGSRVYERSNRTLGMTPQTYAGGGTGVTVRYAIGDSPLGSLLVAATDRGVCSVKVGSDEADLEQQLKAEYPNAVFAPSNHTLADSMARVVAGLKPGAPDSRLPVDIRATAFQRLVWQQLQTIPRGETRTYQEVARAIGRPAAARAVARACASNPVALIVPCHRVIPAAGGSGGYRWGASRKRALLQAERDR
jgi:AraC family transcriptional regulator, regulatory protein of adaptative response / methylated-DNA-[protein]-cysteine methyltransferase